MKGVNQRKLERLELSNKPTLKINQEFKNKINFLHKKVGSLEWSGELITSEQGSINDLDNWIITAEDIFLVDVGSAGYTSYEVDKGAFKAADVAQLYDAYPGLLDGSLKAHHIHTHHNMNAFFSGTDWENLEDRAIVSNYFLMLIVNFSGDYKAKVAFKANLEASPTKIVFANNDDGFEPMTLGSSKEGERLVVMDCKIEMEDTPVTVPQEFEDRYNRVVEAAKQEAEEKKKSYTTYSQPQIGYKRDHGEPQTYGGMGDLYDSDYHNSNGLWVPKETTSDKKIYDMTEKEWNRWEKEHQWMRSDFHALMNAVIDDRPKPKSIDSCIIRLEYLAKKLKTKIDKENLLSSIQFSIRDMFDKMYIGKDDYDYANLMNVGREILEPYSERDELTKGVLDILEEEIIQNLKTV